MINEKLHSNVLINLQTTSFKFQQIRVSLITKLLYMKHEDSSSPNLALTCTGIHHHVHIKRSTTIQLHIGLF
jgi:hypothetical protein